MIITAESVFGDTIEFELDKNDIYSIEEYGMGEECILEVLENDGNGNSTIFGCSFPIPDDNNWYFWVQEFDEDGGFEQYNVTNLPKEIEDNIKRQVIDEFNL